MSQSIIWPLSRMELPKYDFTFLLNHFLYSIFNGTAHIYKVVKVGRSKRQCRNTLRCIVLKEGYTSSQARTRAAYAARCVSEKTPSVGRAFHTNDVIQSVFIEKKMVKCKWIRNQAQKQEKRLKDEDTYSYNLDPPLQQILLLVQAPLYLW